MLRGKLKNKPVGVKPLIINLKHLESFKKGATVSVDTLIKNKVLPASAKDLKVKVLGDGDLKVALTIKLPVSKAAAVKIKKAGGKVVEAKPKTKPATKKVAKPKKAAPKTK